MRNDSEFGIREWSDETPVEPEDRLRRLYAVDPMDADTEVTGVERA